MGAARYHDRRNGRVANPPYDTLFSKEPVRSG